MKNFLIETAVAATPTPGLLGGAGAINSTNANVAAGAFLNRIADLLLAIALPLAILAVVFAAYSLIKSQGKPDGYANAKKYLIYVASGIFFIVFARILVTTIYNLIRV
jgi:hypothetical protein